MKERGPRRGQEWELAVRAYLEKQGWQVLEANYRSPYGEIDLIAIEPGPQGETVVFVEVRARRHFGHGTPLESVDAPKRARILATAAHWLAQHAQWDTEPACRFDIASVLIGPSGTARINLHRAAFDASDTGL